MFVTKKRFNELLGVLGLRFTYQGSISSRFWTASAHTDCLHEFDKRITKLEETSKALIDYLELEYKTETTEKLPRFVKKITYYALKKRVKNKEEK